MLYAYFPGDHGFAVSAAFSNLKLHTLNYYEESNNPSINGTNYSLTGKSIIGRRILHSIILSLLNRITIMVLKILFILE